MSSNPRSRPQQVLTIAATWPWARGGRGVSSGEGMCMSGMGFFPAVTIPSYTAQAQKAPRLR